MPSEHQLEEGHHKEVLGVRVPSFLQGFQCDAKSVQQSRSVTVLSTQQGQADRCAGLAIGIATVDRRLATIQHSIHSRARLTCAGLAIAGS